MATLRHLQSRPQLALVALEEMNSTPYLSWVRNELFSSVTDWQNTLNPIKTIDIATNTILTEFTINGTIGLYIWWLKNNMQYPVDDLVDQISNVIINLYSGFYNIK